MKTLNRKIEEWIAGAISSVAPGVDLAVELASTSDETSSIRRVIIDGTQTGYVDGSIPSDGDRTATVQVLLESSAHRVAASDHDDLATQIHDLLGDDATMRDAAADIADFYLYFPGVVESGGSTNGTRGDDAIRQTAFTLSAVLCRDDNGDNT